MRMEFLSPTNDSVHKKTTARASHELSENFGRFSGVQEKNFIGKMGKFLRESRPPAFHFETGKYFTFRQIYRYPLRKNTPRYSMIQFLVRTHSRHFEKTYREILQTKYTRLVRLMETVRMLCLPLNPPEPYGSAETKEQNIW